MTDIFFDKISETPMQETGIMKFLIFFWRDQTMQIDGNIKGFSLHFGLVI